MLPSKIQPVIYVGTIKSGYQFDKGNPNPFYHWREVEWLSEPVPRSHFPQDLLYSFGAFLTICQISRNNADARLDAMAANGWKPETTHQLLSASNMDSLSAW